MPAGADGAAPIPQPGRGVADRRAFLTWTGTAGAVGVVAAVGGRALAGRPRPGTTSVDVVLPRPTATLPGVADARRRPPSPRGSPSTGISPLITPNADFYRIDTALTLPRPDLDGWRLRLDGEVDSPFALSFDELLAMPQVEAPITIACVSNKVGGDLVGTAVWQGVPLADLLERAGVRRGPDAEQIVGRSLDGFTVGFPTAAALDGRTALVAVGMNGEPLPREHGFPARLIVEGLYGYVSATKWLSSIELRGWDYDAYWIPLGWSKEGPIKTQSRIDVPRSGTERRGRTGRRGRRGVGPRPGHPRRRGPGRRRRLAAGRARPGDLRRHVAPVAVDRGTPSPAATPCGSGRPTAPARCRPRRWRRPSPTGPRAGTAARSR